MKTFKITESYTGYVEYEIKANNEFLPVLANPISVPKQVAKSNDDKPRIPLPIIVCVLDYLSAH